MLSEPNISYKPFWGICRPLKSWRANSPNPIQIYCAKIEKGQLWLYQNRPNIFGHYKTDYPQNGFFYLPNEVIFLFELTVHII